MALSFFTDSLLHYSTSHATAKLLDVEFFQLNGAAGEAHLRYEHNTVSLLQMPGATLHGINSDRSSLVSWERTSVAFLPAGTTTLTNPTKRFDSTAIGIPAPWWKQAIELYTSIEFRFLPPRVDQYMLGAANLLCALAFSGASNDDTLLAETLIVRLVARVLYHLASEAGRPRIAKCPDLAGERLRLVLDYIEANLDQQIRLGDLAAVAGLSMFHFSRTFRAAVGATPMRYILSRRIERARELMRDTRDSLADIALQCGFSSQSHFTTTFREAEGVTPSEYRTALRR